MFVIFFFFARLLWPLGKRELLGCCGHWEREGEPER